MVIVVFTNKFKEIFSKIKDNSLKERIVKQIEKVKINPEAGKPMRNVRKGTRELYVGPFRLSYEFFRDRNLVYILDLYHKDEQ
jgi:mRNA-degrading endonuclease RelE of RelBE toxin-antitoxin system